MLHPPDLVGDDSYTYQNLEPYFQRAVTFTPPNNEKRGANVTSQYDPSAFATTGGPVQVGYTNYVSPFSTWLEKALLAVGLKKTAGFSNGQLLGTHYTQTTIRASDQTRSASDAYIKNALANPNLAVYTHTLAQRILFNANNTATGVAVESGGLTSTIHASAEVILAAGAFQSPQLLMVSGVGPRSTLETRGIATTSCSAVAVDTLDRTLHDPVALAGALAAYATQADGVLSSNVVELLGWEKLPAALRANFSRETLDALAAFPDDWPEVELISANGFIGDFALPVPQQPLSNKQYATVLGALVAPTSRGNVSIASPSAGDPPVIDPAWLTAPADQEVAVALFRRLRQIWASGPMREIVVGDEYWPGSAVESDEDVLEVRDDGVACGVYV
ncbi:hypothetical protein SLS58_006840 [Diplodia intermedia]|uniref:Glucose-methanol-choline oxidoreductase N-terminal domain-containing protein n=1 Tax=Diplodia intermedia TaxID=856260 RepID=A0ABR3TLL4_9PEZI